MKAMFKKSLLFASIFTILFTSMPKQEAKAGILLAPTGAGIVIIILGVYYNSLGLVILNDESATSKLAHDFRVKYGYLTTNQQVFEGLAVMVLGKLPAEGLDREVEINFSRREILKALGPAAADRELVRTLSADLM